MPYNPYRSGQDKIHCAFCGGRQGLPHDSRYFPHNSATGSSCREDFITVRLHSALCCISNVWTSTLPTGRNDPYRLLSWIKLGTKLGISSLGNVKRLNFYVRYKTFLFYCIAFNAKLNPFPLSFVNKWVWVLSNMAALFLPFLVRPLWILKKCNIYYEVCLDKNLIIFHNILLYLLWESVSPHNYNPSVRTAPCRLSATVYLKHSHLLSTWPMPSLP
jgi:hypothetical protein